MAEAPTGIPIRLEPLVTRLLAPNPSPYTHTGTQSYLIGTEDLAVIDPGPESDPHQQAMLAEIAGRPVKAILITHHHRDHSPGARALAAATGAPIIGAAPFAPAEAAARADASFDAIYAPDRVLADGESVVGTGWTLTAVATPGHTSNHVAFALPETGALFSGDHVMGWSTTVVLPPDGDMGQYMASLEKLMGRDDRIYYPGHGDAVEQPRRLVRGMLGHRKHREGQILRLLAGGARPVEALLPDMYASLDPRLLPAAKGSVLAHLLDLGARGLVGQEDGAWARR
ncbi:MBL fold metallo-hydrolase [Sphingomonas aerophila]|uniref:Glyoxylase-like metal-dependent hydrolase (Beta-lactamase superfamily II) n=1 Tax=Sphingomonas aerophila TaxID=1344948 RepID=A0A7W9BEA8_9SPHN|nr:MBL fold metallo-hydrolase [Sphingomonas aerophila]MBB5715286.1 glyoxylase-like metal-dependent hydrolase (beta-lactamase superfamily II) [Sphingomonas aerophila]